MRRGARFAATDAQDSFSPAGAGDLEMELAMQDDAVTTDEYDWGDN